MAERAAVESLVNNGFSGLYFYFPHIQTNKEKSVGLLITGKSTTFRGILPTQDREGKKHPRTPFNFLPVRPPPYPHPPVLESGSIRQGLRSVLLKESPPQAFPLKMSNIYGYESFLHLDSCLTGWYCVWAE